MRKYESEKPLTLKKRILNFYLEIKRTGTSTSMGKGHQIDKSIAMPGAIRQYNQIYKAKLKKSIYILSNILRLKLKQYPSTGRPLRKTSATLELEGRNHHDGRLCGMPTNSSS